MKPKGRPKKFSREDILDSAMQVFWRQGFDCASISTLCDACDLKPPSLYAQFGDKSGMFIEVLAHYHKQYQQSLEALIDTKLTALDKLSAVLDLSLKSHTANLKLGCLIAGSATLCRENNQHIANSITYYHTLNESLIIRCIESGSDYQSLSSKVNAKKIARFVNGVLQGAATLSRAQQSDEAIIDLLSLTKESLRYMLSNA